VTSEEPGRPEVDPTERLPSDLPGGIDPRGVLRRGGGRDAFVLGLAITVALLALIFTLGWVVYHRLTVQQGLASRDSLLRAASSTLAPQACARGAGPRTPLG
jgi:hypothetical protein